jgi:hypothetical protein
MSQLVYSAARPFLGLIWRILRVFTLWKLRMHYLPRYHLAIFDRGNGVHYKWLFTDAKSNNQYLVKTTTDFIEWWHSSVFNFKKRLNLSIDYESLKFNRIVEDLKRLTSIPSLNALTLIERIDVSRREIWYHYLKDAETIDVDNPSHISMWEGAKLLLQINGFRHADDKPDNYLIYYCPAAASHRIFVIDLESIIYEKF